MAGDYIVVLITTPSQETARTIARLLLEKKLAACASILSSVNSLYTWKGEIHDDQEALMLVKTRTDLFNDEFMQAVKANHPYEVPEMIALPILAGYQPYLDWMSEVTQ
jgi:periplasmic divalent cation tolerance protein